jgi:hypothetical protein
MQAIRGFAQTRRVSVLSGSYHQSQSLREIAWQVFRALHIRQSQSILGLSITLINRLAIPDERLRLVLGNCLTVVVQDAEPGLRRGNSLLGQGGAIC